MKNWWKFAADGPRRIWLVGVLISSAVLLCSCEPVGLSWAPESDRAAVVWRMTVDSQDAIMLSILDVHPADWLIPGVDAGWVIPEELPTPQDGVPGDGLLSTPAWSRDGRYVAYYRYQGGELGPSSRAATSTRESATRPADAELLEAELVILRTDSPKERTVIQTRLRAGTRYASGSSFRLIPAPVWSRDSGHVFYARFDPESGKYRIQRTCLKDGAGGKTSLLSTDGRLWASLTRPVIATLDGRAFVLLDTKTGKQRIVPLPIKASTKIVVVSGDLKMAAMPSAEGVLLVDLSSGKDSSFPYENRSDSLIDIAFARDGKYVYYLVRTGAAGGPKGIRDYEVRRIDLSSKRITTAFRCPDAGRASMLSVSPDERRVFAVMQYGDGGEECRFALVDKTGRSAVKLTTSALKAATSRASTRPNSGDTD